MLLEDGDLMAARAAADDVLARDAGRPEALFVAGAVAFQLGDAAVAESKFRGLVDAMPDEPTAHFNLGNALKALDRPVEAIEAYRRAVAIAPDYAPAFNNLGNVLSSMGNPSGAIEAYRQAIAVEPDNAEALANLGHELRLGGDLAAACECLDRACHLEPGMPSFHVGYAQALAAAGNAAEALNAIDRGLESAPGQSTLMAAKIQLLTVAGRAAEAAAIADLSHFMLRLMAKPPQEYASLDDFNRALAAYVLGHPELTESGAGERRVDDLLAVSSSGTATRAVDALRDLLGAVVTEYIRLLPDDPRHPFLRHKPRGFHLLMWGTVTAPDTPAEARIQGASWLGGLYGVSGQTMELRLGAPLADFPADGDAPLDTIPFEDGMVVLHPSFVSTGFSPAPAESVAIGFAIIPTAVAGDETGAPTEDSEPNQGSEKPSIGKIRLLDS